MKKFFKQFKHLTTRILLCLSVIALLVGCASTEKTQTVYKTQFVAVELDPRLFMPVQDPTSYTLDRDYYMKLYLHERVAYLGGLVIKLRAALGKANEQIRAIEALYNENLKLVNNAGVQK